MESRTHFAGRYKKDLSTDNLRAKVARRKSISQKENRHNEFKKCRGLSMADVNISVVKETELPPLEETIECSLIREHENTIVTKAKEQSTKQRLQMLQRFKDEKQLRRLKEQRDKAAKGVFKCGVYKHDVAVPPVFGLQNATKVKPKERQPAPVVTRVTRSMAKSEPAVNKTNRSQHTGILNSSKTVFLVKGCGPSSSVKKPENKAVSTQRGGKTIGTTTKPALRNSAAVPVERGGKSILAASTKPAPRNNACIKTQNKLTKEIHYKAIKTKDSEQTKLEESDVFQEATPTEREIAADAPVPRKERKPSFAPQNFTFQPLDGLSSFKFQPMTPSRVNAFLTPSFSWSPAKGENNTLSNSSKCNKEKDPEHITVETLTAQEKDAEHIPEETLTAPEKDPEHIPVETLTAPEKDPEHIPVETASTLESRKLEFDNIPTALEIVTADVALAEPGPFFPALNNQKETEQETVEEQKHGVPYFREILKTEIEKLKSLCFEWDKRIEKDIPEEAKDLIRTTVGQTRLLMNERFKQFEGLVDNCEFKRGEKETTCTDLEGFWDMIYFQIEDVGKKFVNLNKLEENSWQQNTVQTKKILKKKIAPIATSKSVQGDNGRAAARSRLAAIKAAMKNKGKQEETTLEVEVSALPKRVDEVVFDAGFFRVESPAKLGVKTKCGSPQPCDTPELRAKSKKIAEHPDSPGCLKSPIRKALFDNTEEESVPSDEVHAEVSEKESVKAESCFPVADLTKYLIPTETSSLQLLESPAQGETVFVKPACTSLFMLENESPSLSVVDDVFMCSPEKNEQPRNITSAGEPNAASGNEEVGTIHPLDFLGSCTPKNMVEK
ncbi:hypothetical protein GDO86_016178 [Hymenochirus boettgeri]|uniref:Disks large-associated protein 5 n=1 Tax=Hymenochirus boettgeri TaxID=247094 RepID=A0A8T2K204_9PIPI|nr:hypothetical protein GDO86_016178 [Hymenochirus boettgeri]